VVVGGGADVDDGGRGTVRLTSLMPLYIKLIENHVGRYYAEAESPGHDRSFPWSLHVYAICVDDFAVVDYSVHDAFIHNGTSKKFDHVEAVCPSGTVAWGAGASVWGLGADGGAIATGELGLQLVRTDHPLTIARATARESSAGFEGPWRLLSRVVCAKRKTWTWRPAPFGPLLEDRGLQADWALSQSPATGNRCPDGYYTHGTGGGAGTTDGGPVFLHAVRPHADLRGVTAVMTTSITGVGAYQTCAR
jgi:hypothetical protein